MESLEILRKELDLWSYLPFYLQPENCKSRTLSTGFVEMFALRCIQMERWLSEEGSLWELDLPPLNGAKQYSLDDLKEMTDNFSSKYFIKKTQHGRLFRGFSDNREVTIKTWDFFCPEKRVYGDHPMRFCNELEILLGENPHPTLMKLRGFCFKHILAVVYDEKYDEKPTNFLLEELYAAKNFGLDARMKVATQLASLFNWLHDKGMTFVCLQTSTIMIDKDFNIKVFDFGFLYRVNEEEDGRDGDHYFCSEAPEAVDGVQTKKSDVYAFGVVLLQLIAKTDYLPNDHISKLHKWIWGTYDGSDIRPIMDRSVVPNDRQAKKFNKLVVACLQKDPDARPDMKDVLVKLEHNLRLEKECCYSHCVHSQTSQGSWQGIPYPLLSNVMR